MNRSFTTTLPSAVRCRMRSDYTYTLQGCLVVEARPTCETDPQSFVICKTDAYRLTVR